MIPYIVVGVIAYCFVAAVVDDDDKVYLLRQKVLILFNLYKSFFFSQVMIVVPDFRESKMRFNILVSVFLLLPFLFSIRLLYQDL